ncbi:tyrosine-type recombinase/integrase [Carboxylicivirga sp. N1Y90]|uniref:tyrosine-type recombinase/integrase n=1 Tax=Carboxylicivirga fragile TaxID=3417571 RepID=UPI003D34A6BD|nr:hypothetical protein [Marinilabiliaceae bacterium N1Y90]
MSSIKFNLKDTRKPEKLDSRISLKINHSGERLQFVIPNLRITFDNWDKQKNRSYIKNSTFNKVLDVIQIECQKIINRTPEIESLKHFKGDINIILENIENIYLEYYPTQTIVDKLGDVVVKDITKAKISYVEKDTIEVLFDNHLYDYRNKLTDVRLLNIKSCLEALKKCNLSRIDIHKWNNHHFDEFVEYFLDNGRLNSTIKEKVRVVKSVIRKFDSDHTTLKFDPPNVINHRNNTILTEAQLVIVENLTLEDAGLKKVKDLFLFACYTGQRFKDIQCLSKSEIKDNFWSVNQEKTGNDVNVPIIKKARLILEKYNYNLPKISIVGFNAKLKIIGKEANLDEPYIKKRKQGNKRKEDKRPLYKWMSSHIAKRIFITHSLNKGIPIHIIAEVVGNDLVSMEHYIQVTKDVIGSHYFKDNTHEKEKGNNN